MTSDDLTADVIKHPAKYGLTACLVCRNPDTSMTSAYEPTAEFGAKIGQPPDKLRRIMFRLCDDCWNLPDAPAHIERAILWQLGAKADALGGGKSDVV